MKKQKHRYVVALIVMCLLQLNLKQIQYYMQHWFVLCIF